jgi:hypothetical protein
MYIHLLLLDDLISSSKECPSLKKNKTNKRKKISRLILWPVAHGSYNGTVVGIAICNDIVIYLLTIVVPNFVIQILSVEKFRHQRLFWMNYIFYIVLK